MIFEGIDNYHMVNWEHICSPKEVGGLRVINTKIMNWCLMTKWAWKILTGQGGLWLSIFSSKYLRDRGVDFRSNVQSSQFAKDMKKASHLLRLGTKFVIQNGKAASFWLDVWCGEQALCERFPALFAIFDKPNAKVVDVWANSSWQPRFRRSLGPIESSEWEVSWKLEASGRFSTGSLYKEFFKTHTTCDLC